MNPAKIHPSLAVAMTAKGFDESLVHVILRLRPGPIAHGDIAALGRVPTVVDFALLAARAVAATADMIAALTEDPAVEMIWPDLPVHTWLHRSVPLIQAPRVWDSAFTGRGVRIAVVDTGIDPTHPDFADRVVAYRDFVAPDAAGATDPRDPNGHGTHVAGIAAGSGAAQDGRFRGVAPEAELLIARVLDASGNGLTSTVMAGVEWAVAQGAQIVNISLGGQQYPSDATDAFSLLCDAAVQHGVVVCVAAGNLGPIARTIGSPAATESVITVGATVSDTAAATTDRVAAFSSRGPTGTGSIKPDVVFPGVGIVSARAAGTVLGTPVGARYTAVSGTSQATPMATGTAALLLQANPRLTPAELKARLRRGARRLPTDEPTAQGTGRGDAYNTFVSAAGTPLATSPSTSSPETSPAPEARAGCVPGTAAGLLGR